MKINQAITILSLVSAVAASLRASDDIRIADFEGANYGNWKTTGEAFGPGPAQGTLPGQMEVKGFLGHGLANSFHKGDASTGTLSSPEFSVVRQFISFRIGGGGFARKTCMDLLIDGKIVRTAAGPNTNPGGSEELAAASWNVSEFAGKSARIQIVDDATGGWGHINVDQIVLTDAKPPGLLADQKREFLIAKRYLNIPIKNGAPKRKVTVLVDGHLEVELNIELAPSAPDWWAPLDAGAWQGKRIALVVDKLPEDSSALKSIEASDEIKGAQNLYLEALRPQLHFSPRRGWNNDPNGLVHYNGEYHLFFQHNPYGWSWENMHWGHAVSRDLVHWREIGDVLAPDNLGPMFSGSAVVDWNNSSGFGKDGQPPQVLIYTAAGNPTVQCLAFSNDGRTYTKFAGNPILKEISGGNRDPKVIWHGPTKKWVMTLYVAVADPVKKDDKGNPVQTDTIQFLSSPNLKDWNVMSRVDGFFECPDFFELPVDGDETNKKWILTAANSDYRIGSFDGITFKPETDKLKGHLGRGFYAAQTFSDMSDGRRIQIGWLQAETPGMPFNQAMTLPLQLTLRQTPAGPRLAINPAQEIETLRAKSNRFDGLNLDEGGPNPLAGLGDELLELRATFKPGNATEVAFSVRGVPVVYDVKKQELSVNGHRAPAPMRDGSQSLIVYADRTAFEVFASDGLAYVPMPVVPKANDKTIVINVKGATVHFSTLELHTLKSAWQ
jgi:sucrose-6-phosphate hydrolase SacC (GH32 family)